MSAPAPVIFVADGTLAEAPRWQLWPTTVLPSLLAQFVCLSVLGNSSPLADSLFNDARERARHIELAKGARLVRSELLEGNGAALSGVDLASNRKVRIGTPEAVREWLSAEGGSLSAQAHEVLDLLSDAYRRVLVVADQKSDLGVVIY
ncbi:MAG: hypothetical protein HY075_00815 [Deltaproteobacteria bacterium]|nr:hypothetical protein [Deltaproteobacteria bacterium]